jgi:hypothetical protein
MRRRTLVTITAAVAISTHVARAQVEHPKSPRSATEPAGSFEPTTQPEQTLAEAKLTESLGTAIDALVLPRVSVDRLSELFELRVRDKNLEVVSPHPEMEKSVVAVPSLEGLTTAEVQHADGGKADSRPIVGFSLTNIDYTIPGIVYQRTDVTQPYPARVTLTQDRQRLDDEVYSVQLLQNLLEADETEPKIRLYVQVTAEPKVDLRLSADNIVELRRRFPAEVAKYVDPIFLTLHQDGLLAKVDPRLAWQVFADAYKPTPELESRVNAVLKRLDADDFQQREQASKELGEIGQPAAIYLRGAARTGWTEEQSGRVDTFLAKFQTIEEAKAKKYRTDREFLIDCLYADDETIRRLALGELQKLIGRSIELDVAAAPEQRYIALRRLRAEIGTPASSQAKERAD